MKRYHTGVDHGTEDYYEVESDHGRWVKFKDIPKGHRLLNLGEKIKKGDEYYNVNKDFVGSWRNIPISLLGVKVVPNLVPIRRKI